MDAASGPGPAEPAIVLPSIVLPRRPAELELALPGDELGWAGTPCATPAPGTQRPEPPLASPMGGPRSARQPQGHRDPHSSRRRKGASKKADGVRLRRFFFNELTQNVKPTLPLHYDVLMPSSLAKDGEHDHLRYRYVDFVCPPTTAWHGMLDVTDEGADVDVKQLMNFFTVAEPRTRIDAYPMYVLLRDLLHRQLKGTLNLKHEEAEAAKAENDQLRRKLAEQAMRLAELERQLSADGVELRRAEVVQRERNKAEAALSKAETLLSQLRTNKFKLAAYREKADKLAGNVDTLKAEADKAEASEGEEAASLWSFVDLEQMLSEALDERGPDDQTLEQTFMLLGEDSTKRLHLRMKRSYPTTFKDRVKYKFIIVNGRNQEEDAVLRARGEEGSTVQKKRASLVGSILGSQVGPSLPPSLPLHKGMAARESFRQVTGRKYADQEDEEDSIRRCDFHCCSLF